MNNEPLHTVDCIIPAAGLSSRMGDWKMMLPFGEQGQTILDCSISNALKFCRHAILVTGFRGNELSERYKNNPRIKVTYNPNFKEGLFTSVQAGLKKASTEYVFISHGDMPLVDSSIFIQLWQERQKDILFPAHNGITGHPVLLHRSCFQKVLSLPANHRMKDLLKKSPHRYIRINSTNILLDIDTPIAYQEATAITALQ